MGKRKFMLYVLVAVLMAALVMPTVPACAEDGVVGFVTRLYELTLDRAPDQGGLNYWVNELNAGRKTGADVSENFIFSKEFVSKNLSDSDFLNVMYRAFFNREPDDGGKNFWIGKLNEGYNRRYILAQFVNSQEFNSICKSYEIVPGAIKLSDSDLIPNPSNIHKSNLRVHFIDVGQADSIFIEDGTNTMLIDAGNNDDSNTVVNYIKGLGYDKLNYVIGTHPHEDHVGGLDVAIQTFDVEKVIMPKVSHTTQTYEDVLMAIQNKGLTITPATPGASYKIGNGTFTIIAPNSNSYEDLNNYSVVIKLEYGNTSFLFTGDAESKSEGEIIAKGYNISADVLKVGHHGSASSTTDSFLDVVNPKYAVISVGKNNDYGHPAKEVLDKLQNKGIQVFRTDVQGTIIATTNGSTVTFNNEPTEKDSAPSEYSVQIVNIDLAEEVVTIQNSGDTDIDMTGWKLVSVEGNQTFDFPAGYILKAGATVKVVSGRGANGDGINTLKWTGSYIWNNSGDKGELYDGNGKLVSSK